MEFYGKHVLSHDIISTINIVTTTFSVATSHKYYNTLFFLSKLLRLEIQKCNVIKKKKLILEISNAQMQ